MTTNHLSAVWLTLLLLGGCSTLIGLGDYEIDRSLDGSGGEPSLGGNDGEGGTESSGGDPGEGGKPSDGGTSGEAGAGGLGEGGAPGRIVDCDSDDCCTELGGTPVGIELIEDGGFELGTPDDGSPWSQVSTTTSNELFVGSDEFGFTAHSGDWYAYLSGIAEEQSTIYQNVRIPEHAGWLVVSGYRRFQIDAEDEMNSDFCGIGFYELPSGDLLELPFFWSKPSDGGDGFGDTPDWKSFEASWDAAPHRGLRRQILFRGSSDAYPVPETKDDLDASSYLFDDLSFKAFHCVVPRD